MILSKEFKKDIIFRVANNVRELLQDDYLNISDDEFQEAIFNNLSDYLQDDIEISTLIKEVLEEKEIEIEQVEDPREEEEIKQDLKEAILEGDYQGQIYIQSELIRHLQQQNNFLQCEILKLWKKITKLMKLI